MSKPTVKAPANHNGIIAAVGDMMFDRRLTPPRMFFYHPDVSSCRQWHENDFRFSFLNTRESREWLARHNHSTFAVDTSSHAFTSRPIVFPDEAEDPGYPFRAIANYLRGADVVFGNLECPLSNRGRRTSNDVCYCAPPEFAAALAAVGFRVVSCANNHTFDFGETAFLDTLEALRDNGITVVGAGVTLEVARRPARFDVNGVSVAILAYTMIGSESIYVGNSESGVMPFNPMVAEQDIDRIRQSADIVLISIHWGRENQSVPSPRQIELAHDLIEAGADAILGHHSHIVGSVEVYQGRPIFYSLGNFSFGHDHSTWGDDMIVTLQIENARLRRADMTPIRGRFQPALVIGDDARAFHRHLTDISRTFRTEPAFIDGKSVIELLP